MHDGPPGCDLPRGLGDQASRAVAVTGAFTYLGGELIRRLEADPRCRRVLALDVRKPPRPRGVTRYHRVDLTLPSAGAELGGLLAREGIDTLVHAAFLSAPTHDAGLAHELETVGTGRVLAACREAGVGKLVQLSTTLVYGPSPHHPNFLDEGRAPQGPTGAAFLDDKRQAEQEALRYAAANPDRVVTVLRAAPTVGPTVRNLFTRFFRRPVATRLLGFDPLVQLLHERDLVDAFALAVWGDAPGVLHLAGDGVLPLSTVLAMMGKVTLPLPAFLAYPAARALWAAQVADAPPGFVDFLRYLCVVDAGRARRELGFRPRYDVRATIADFLGLLPGPRRLECEVPALAAAGGRPTAEVRS